MPADAENKSVQEARDAQEQRIENARAEAYWPREDDTDFQISYVDGDSHDSSSASLVPACTGDVYDRAALTKDKAASLKSSMREWFCTQFGRSFEENAEYAAMLQERERIISLLEQKGSQHNLEMWQSNPQDFMRRVERRDKSLSDWHSVSTEALEGFMEGYTSEVTKGFFNSAKSESA